jgi:hypothetical protein
LRQSGRPAAAGQVRPTGFASGAKSATVPRRPCHTTNPNGSPVLERPDQEPVFAAPFVSPVMKVEPEWIDYNGHLNMAYYNMLFDRAVDEAYELMGCGLAY